MKHLTIKAIEEAIKALVVEGLLELLQSNTGVNNTGVNNTGVNAINGVSDQSVCNLDNNAVEMVSWINCEI